MRLLSDLPQFQRVPAELGFLLPLDIHGRISIDSSSVCGDSDRKVLDTGSKKEDTQYDVKRKILDNCDILFLIFNSYEVCSV